MSTNKSFFIKSYRDSGNSLYGDIKKLDALGDEARFPWSSCQTFHCNVFILPSWYIDHLFWVSRAIMRAFLNQLNLTRIIKLQKIIHQFFFLRSFSHKMVNLARPPSRYNKEIWYHNTKTRVVSFALLHIANLIILALFSS